MTHEELEESIQWEAEQYIPFDINDVYLDVTILNEHSLSKDKWTCCSSQRRKT